MPLLILSCGRTIKISKKISSMKINLFLLFFCFFLNANAQIKFESFSNTSWFKGVVADKDTIWAATMGGVFKFNKNGTLIQEYHNTDGLANNEVTAVFIDKKGNKWFGTYYGNVSKYDGKHWTSYYVGVKDGIDDLINGITAIVEDLKGNIWISSHSGVKKFDGNTWITYNDTNSLLRFDTVEAMVVDPNGTLWFGISGYAPGICSFDGTTWNLCAEGNALLSMQGVYSIGIDSEGSKWFGNNVGVLKYDGKTWTYFKADKFKIDEFVRLFIDKQDNLWLTNIKQSGVSDIGLLKYNIKNDISIVYPDVKGYVSNISQNNNDLYFTIIKSSTNVGIYRFDGNIWQSYKAKGTFGDNMIISSAVDKNGNVWFGTYIDGITKYDGTTFTNFNTQNSSIGSNRIFCITQAGNGDIYAGTSSGVSKYSDGKWVLFYSTSQVYGIGFDSKQNLWIATDGSGAMKFDGTNWISFKKENSSIGSNEFYCMHIDKKDNIWLGSFDRGISMYDGTSFKLYNVMNGTLGFNYVSYITSDNKGNIWVSVTGNGGLYKYDGIKWTNYKKTNSPLRSNFVFSISEDKNNNMWFGYSYSGISVFDGTNILDETKWKHYDINNSNLICNSIFSSVIDKAGNKWFTTSWGVSKISGSPFMITGINELNNSNGIILYPNPTKDNLQITINTQFNEDYTVEIFNSSGSLLLAMRKNKSVTNFNVDLKSYPAGLYFLHFTSKDKMFQRIAIKR